MRRMIPQKKIDKLDVIEPIFEPESDYWRDEDGNARGIEVGSIGEDGSAVVLGKESVDGAFIGSTDGTLTLCNSNSDATADTLVVLDSDGIKLANATQIVGGLTVLDGDENEKLAINAEENKLNIGEGELEIKGDASIPAMKIYSKTAAWQVEYSENGENYTAVGASIPAYKWVIDAGSDKVILGSSKVNVNRTVQKNNALYDSFVAGTEIEIKISSSTENLITMADETIKPVAKLKLKNTSTGYVSAVTIEPTDMDENSAWFGFEMPSGYEFPPDDNTALDINVSWSAAFGDSDPSNAI